MASLEGYFYRWLKTYRMVDVIICPSDFIKDKLAANARLALRTLTLHNFLTEETAGINEAAVTQGGKSAGSGLLPEALRGKGYLIYFGRYSAEKGVGTLLEACQRLPDINFVFAGKGELLEKVQAVGNVWNVGFQNGAALFDLVRQAKFSIFPSECYENCPFSVMESQRCGTPVLAAEIGGTVELIKSGETGEFFQPGNTDELCAKILSLWHDDEKISRYTNNCRADKFDTIGQYCDKVIKIYRHCLDKNN